MAKRGFYEDDAVVVTKPGYSTEIDSKLKKQEESHGNVSFIEGMSVRTAPYLEKYTNAARLWTHDQLVVINAELQTQKSSLNNEVNNITSQVSSLVKEPVLPASIFVLTSTLTGSILASRRGFTLRFLSPIVFGVASLSYFMPKTFDEISSRIAKVEKESVPDVYNAQQDALKSINTWTQQSQVQYQDFQKCLTEQVHSARKFIGDLFD